MGSPHVCFDRERGHCDLRSQSTILADGERLVGHDISAANASSTWAIA
jgi:hypothetical protein